MILDWLEKEKPHFKKCSVIGFDNVARVAVVHGGVQHRLENIIGKAKFVLFSNPSLYLCGIHATAVNASAIIFFGVIETLFIFSSSNHRREYLSLYMKVMRKPLVTTR